MSAKGKLFLIPTYLDPSNGPEIIAPMVKQVITNTEHFIVEHVRTARRYISSLDLGLDISSLGFQVLNKRSSSQDLQELLKPLHTGKDVGVMSEAGLPGIADPGRLVVDIAHRQGISVVPLPGPSSIIQALIASGFDGQHFTFHGYLAIDKSKKTKQLLALQRESQRTGATQIFMETPYRNNQMMTDLVSTLPPDVHLCVASCITGTDEFIQTQSLREWAKKPKDLNKKPTIFLLGSRPH